MKHRYCVVFYLALAACGIHVDYSPLNPAPRDVHARLPSEVEVFEGVDVPRRHVEIGTIDARRQSHNRASQEELVDAIRQEAARHGCDAVRIVGRADVSQRVGYRAACLVYIDAAASLAPSNAVSPETPAAPLSQDAHDAGAM